MSASLKAAYIYPNRIGNDWESYRDSYETTFLGYSEGIYASLVRFSRLTGSKKYLPALKKIVDTKYSFAGKRAVYGGYTVPVNYSEMEEYRELSGDTCYGEEISNYEAQCVKDWEHASPLPNILLLDHATLRVPWDAWTKWAYRDGDGKLVECPDALGSPFIAYQKTGNSDILADAMEQARVRLRMARFSLRDGREHGCAGRHFIHGPGGSAARLLNQLTTGWHGFDEQDPTNVLYYHGDGRLGLPDQVAAFLKSGEEKERHILLYNTSDEAVDLVVEIKNAGAGVSSMQSDISVRQDGMRCRMSLPPYREIALQLTLSADRD